VAAHNDMVVSARRGGLFCCWVGVPDAVAKWKDGGAGQIKG